VQAMHGGRRNQTGRSLEEGHHPGGKSENEMTTKLKEKWKQWHLENPGNKRWKGRGGRPKGQGRKKKSLKKEREKKSIERLHTKIMVSILEGVKSNKEKGFERGVKGGVLLNSREG